MSDKSLTDRAMDQGKSRVDKGTAIARGMKEGAPTEMFVVSFPTVSKADEVLAELGRLNDERLLALGDAAVIRRLTDGGVEIEETADFDTREGAIAGAAAGGLLGLLSGRGLIGAALLGAGGGALAANGIDLGIDDDLLNEIGAGLEPDSSAIVATVEFSDVAASMEALDEFDGGTILHTTLSPEVVEMLSAAMED
jgi:uncharacterized membrane protein